MDGRIDKHKKEKSCFWFFVKSRLILDVGNKSRLTNRVTESQDKTKIQGINKKYKIHIKTN